MKGDAAYETACVVKYTTWPESPGVTIDNEMGDAAYDGTAADNDYFLQASGATSFVFNDVTDVVTTPKGATIDNLGNHTFEFMFYYAGGSAATAHLFNKGNIYYG